MNDDDDELTSLYERYNKYQFERIESDRTFSIDGRNDPIVGQLEYQFQSESQFMECERDHSPNMQDGGFIPYLGRGLSSSSLKRFANNSDVHPETNISAGPTWCSPKKAKHQTAGKVWTDATHFDLDTNDTAKDMSPLTDCSGTSSPMHIKQLRLLRIDRSSPIPFVKLEDMEES